MTEQEAVDTAKAELQEGMEKVAENPPAEQPDPLSFMGKSKTDLSYEDPRPNPYAKAITYLEQHNILQLFQHMTANIIFQKPENPLEFMISEISDLKQRRDGEK